MVDILIIGAGPVGLAMAAHCIKYKIKFRIIEKRAHPSKESRALTIHTRTMELFHFLGIHKRFLNKGIPIKKGHIFFNKEKEGEIFTDQVNSPYNFVLSLDQSETEKILEKYIKEKKKKVERKKELLSFKETKQGITAKVRKGKKTETIKCKYLIGCDGAHSTVRHKLHLPFHGGKYPESFALADLQVKFPNKLNGIQAFMHKEGIIAFFPLFRKNRYRVLCSIPKNVSECSLHYFQNLADHRAIPGIKLSKPVWMSLFRIHHRIVPSMRVRNIFLLGDAAHLHSPLGGQGMNLGIHETANLAWKLSRVLKKKSKDSLLDTFNEERYPIISSLIKGTDFGTKMMFSTNPIIRFMRLKVFKFIIKLYPVKKKLNLLLSEVEYHYEGSSILNQNWLNAQGFNVGTRIPDVSLKIKNKTVKLFDLIKKPSHTILIISNNKESKTISTKLKKYGDYYVIKPTAKLTQFFGTNNGIYIIRPDGYVGCRTDSLNVKEHINYFSNLVKN